MNSREYEDFVEETLKCLDFFNNSSIYRNKKYQGVRQAGSYEIDIAFETEIHNMIKFTLIVECKYHGRPITRPIVQNLHQTKEAINAQKGALVSPIGFTKEAIEVADNLGISLWVISKDAPTEIVMAYEGMRIILLSDCFFELFIEYVKLFGIEPKNMNSDYSTKLMSYKKFDNSSIEYINNNHEYEVIEFFNNTREGSAFFSYENHPIFDKSCAIREIIEYLIESNKPKEKYIPNLYIWENNVVDKLSNWIPEHKKDKTDKILQNAKKHIITMNWEKFYKLFSMW
ncbi:restriction endonuclease [Paenibacillus kribbensis]|uniref:restriction endonuclease n=1 Tax=Paenibacillus kribbensis TaxID=172713 RepID=UPI002DB76A97|nr:restriction endonuclease [Paenibacillus kribbensis]MEC0234850.1 restriction endonuclease [Paenibacillus kribbensis]